MMTNTLKIQQSDCEHNFVLASKCLAYIKSDKIVCAELLKCENCNVFTLASSREAAKLLNEEMEEEYEWTEWN